MAWGPVPPPRAAASTPSRKASAALPDRISEAMPAKESLSHRRTLRRDGPCLEDLAVAKAAGLREDRWPEELRAEPTDGRRADPTPPPAPSRIRLGPRGLGFLLGVRVRGFDLGRPARSSYETALVRGRGTTVSRPTSSTTAATRAALPPPPSLSADVVEQYDAVPSSLSSITTGILRRGEGGSRSSMVMFGGRVVRAKCAARKWRLTVRNVLCWNLELAADTSCSMRYILASNKNIIIIIEELVCTTTSSRSDSI